MSPAMNCPFYGHHLASGWRFVLLDSQGNQCALEPGHVPCAMEIEGKTPDWKECPLVGKIRFSTRKNTTGPPSDILAQ